MDHQYVESGGSLQSLASHTSLEVSLEESDLDWRLAKVSFEDSCYCRAFSKGHLGVSFLDKVAKCLGFSESYFGYFCGSYLDLVLLDALASYLGYHIQEVLLEIQEVGHAH